MPQERDPSGRFAKTPGDGAESGPEPEAEPEGPGSLAQLLAAFGEQLRGLEDRQNAARDTDRAALQAAQNFIERVRGEELRTVSSSVGETTHQSIQ